MKLVDIKKISHDPRSKGYLVTLKAFKKNDSLEILVGIKDAKEISLAKEGIDLPRPSAHDVLLDIIDNFDIKIKKIIITDYKTSTYYSKIVLYNINIGEILIDCRPSDGMILSLKSGCPLYISEKLFHVSGIESFSYDIKNDVQTDSKILLKNLNKALNKAILSEEYETAAKLRDEINDLSKEFVRNK